MVLFKRKPVDFPPLTALPADLNVKVWYIAYTKEWFLDYEQYLARMDYYNTRKFVCEITGNSCLTFFEAYESEMKEMKIVEECFPEQLKEPILRYVQFSTVPRIDQLVDNVYSKFKRDYYPGEVVFVRQSDYKNDFKTKCVVREKAKFNAIVDGDNILRPSYCQYRVARLDNNHATIVDESQITRDRSNFTKWFTRTFIKLSVTRSPKLGAPWIVKKQYAEKYRIPTEYPQDLIHFKEQVKQPKTKNGPITIRPKDGGPPAPSSSSSSSSRQKKLPVISDTGRKPVPVRGKIEAPRKTIQEDLSLPREIVNVRPVPRKMEEFGNVVQTALESWTFLNVYRVPLVLDTFTFDDFLTALSWSSSRKRCHLLDEIFCAILSTFLAPDGKSTIVPVPEEFEDDDEDEEDHEKFGEHANGFQKNGNVKSENGDEQIKSENDNEQVRPSNEEIVQDIAESDEEVEEVEEETNKVDEYLTYRNTSWTDRLKQHTFRDGNWQIILLGVLDEVRDVPSWKNTIHKIFDILAPLDANVSPANLQHMFFNEFSLEWRIQALGILCSLLVNTQPIRTHLDKCMEESTHLRRDRMEKIREYKNVYQKAQDVDKELRELIGSNSTPTVTTSTTDETDSNLASTAGKKRRRAGLTIEPKEDEIATAQTNPEYAKLLASRTAQLKMAEGLRLERRALDKKISELDIQRIKYVGKDRMFNRYWWFENNGLPNLKGKGSKSDDDDEEDEPIEEEEDEDDEEFIQETYLMGKLWVQGPSEDDLEHGLKIEKALIKEWSKAIIGSDEDEAKNDDDVKKEDIKEDIMEEKEAQGMSSPFPAAFSNAASKVFNIKLDPHSSVIHSTDGFQLVDDHGAFATGIKPIQRKIIEERPDPLMSCDDWRLYDTTEEIEALIKWLNPWGIRESKLLRELTSIKDQIILSITSRRKALKLDAKSDEELELIEIVQNTVLSDTEEESDAGNDSDDDLDSGENDSDISTELSNLKNELGDSDQGEARRTRKSIAAAEKVEQQIRQKEEELQKKLEERQAKIDRAKPSARIARRELKKRKLKEHQEKKELLETSKERLVQIRSDNELQRCLDWVNQGALETLGYFHYDGPKTRPKEKARRGRR